MDDVVAILFLIRSQKSLKTVNNSRPCHHTITYRTEKSNSYAGTRVKNLQQRGGSDKPVKIKRGAEKRGKTAKTAAKQKTWLSGHPKKKCHEIVFSKNFQGGGQGQVCPNRTVEQQLGGGESRLQGRRKSRPGLVHKIKGNVEREGKATTPRRSSPREGKECLG